MKPAEVDQELFDQVYGKDAVKSEEEFRARIKEELTQQFAADSDFRFLIDVREYLTKRVGKLEFDEELLRRIVKQGEQDGDKEMSDEDFQKSVEELQWHLTRQQLIEKQGLKLEADELQQTAVQAARFQFAQYGMSNIPDEYLLDYAKRMLDNEEQRQSLVRRALDTKLSLALKNVVTLDQKQVSLDDFNKLFEKA